MKVLHFIIIGFLVLAGDSLSFAIPPTTFDLDYSLWKATHIVLATEGNVIDGKLKVIESWRGDLKLDNEIVLPELSAFSTQKSRLIRDFWEQKDMPKQYVRFVTGSKMILFLIKSAQPRPKGLSKPNNYSWLPARYKGYGGFRSSTVWIEKGEAYAHRILSPLLTHQNTDFQTIKSRVAALNAIQTAYDDAVRDTDSERVIQSLRAFLKNKFYYSVEANIQSLGKMGIKALPIFRQSLQDKTLRSRHPEIISSMVQAGGAKVAKDITTIIEKEFEFFSRRAPELKGVWFNPNPGTERQVLIAKYSILKTALHELRPLRYPPCRDIVIKTRDLWRSNEILNYHGRNQILPACDALLKELSSSQQK